MVNDDPFDELLPGYALGILDDEEAASVTAHLRDCGVCRDSLREYESVAGGLSLIMDQKSPSPALKARLIERIEGDARPAEVAERRARGWLQPLWRPALAFAMLALVMGNIFLFTQLNARRDAALAGFEPVTLMGSERAPEASGLIIMSDDGEHGTLIVQHLPPLSESQAYQLWLINDDLREDGGVFGVSGDGYANMWVHGDRPLRDYQAFGVTIEPEGGSEGPTGQNVLTSNR